MQDTESQTRFLVLLIALAMLVGLGVIIFVPDYRFEQNLKTNRDYYPEGVSTAPITGITGEQTQTP